MCVTVFLADDAEMMRRAIRAFLSAREDISVLGGSFEFSGNDSENGRNASYIWRTKMESRQLK
jgi:DNA-binding NarL/FixJ family response regulator